MSKETRWKRGVVSWLLGAGRWALGAGSWVSAQFNFLIPQPAYLKRTWKAASDFRNGANVNGTAGEGD